MSNFDVRRQNASTLIDNMKLDWGNCDCMACNVAVPQIAFNRTAKIKTNELSSYESFFTKQYVRECLVEYEGNEYLFKVSINVAAAGNRYYSCQVCIPEDKKNVLFYQVIREI